MGALRFTRRAERDLNDTWDYIARRNPKAAVDFTAAIRRTCELLSDNPRMGRRREDLPARLRSFPHGQYLIFYRPIKGGVEIVRIVLGTRDIASLF